MIRNLLLASALLFSTGTPTEPVTGDEITTPVETPTTPEFIEKTYTFKDDNYSAVITLTSEKEYTIETTYNDGTKETTSATYEFIDDTLVLYTTISFVKFGDFTINEDGSLTKIVPDFQVPTNKDEAVEEVKKWLGQWLTPQMITLIFTILILLGVGIYFISKDFKNKKYISLSNEKMQENLTKIMESKIALGITTEVDKFIPDILARLETQNDVLKTFAKIMCLAQENTPESRVAILELIQNLGVIDVKNIEASKQIVHEKEAEKVEKAQKQDDELAKIIEDTEKTDDGTTI